MASGTPCLNSRWDKPKPKAAVLQGIVGNVSAPANAGTVVSSRPAGAPGPGSAAASPSSGAPSRGGAELAAAMAAKINAMLMAKGKMRPLQPLPSKAPPGVTPPSSAEEIVITEVDINDVPVNCRNLLTRSKIQEEIHQYSGAAVSTKGLYMSESERSTYSGGERPLYLYVQGRSQDQVNKAVTRIKELIAEDVIRSSGGRRPAVMPTVAVYPQPPRPSVPSRPHASTPRPPNAPVTPAHRPPPPHAGSFVHTKLFVGLEQCLPGFSVNEKVEGPSGSYLQHIQTETGARVFLRGKGSGYIEQASRRESFEPLYLYISHPNAAGLESAKKLCESLLQTVKAEHERTVSTYTATGSTQVSYPGHGYSSAGGSYSSQAWYGYPGTYPTYPTTGSYWSQPSTAEGSQMVQYPVCPRPSTFMLQDEDEDSDGAVNDSAASPNSNSPKRRFIEESENDGGKETTETKPEDPVTEAVCSTSVEVRSSDRVLMPPPVNPVVSLPPPLKRPREEEPAQTHTGEDEELKKVKISEPSALVPYGGDSSDEEETCSVRRSVTP